VKAGQKLENIDYYSSYDFKLTTILGGLYVS
jgi:hypothetical protein